MRTTAGKCITIYIEISVWPCEIFKRLGSNYGCQKQQNATKYFVEIFNDCIELIPFWDITMDDFTSGRVCLVY
jgi:hypothetical protein